MMRKTLKISLAAIAVGTLVAGCGQSPNARGSDDSADIQELVFAAVPSEESQELEESFAPVIKALEKETGLPVRFEAVSSNAGVVEAQVAERVDVAVYGAFSYYLASGVADVTPVAVDQREPGGESGVESYGIVRSDTPAIASLEDAQGKNVCFTDPASSTGYLSPSAGLIEAGIDVKSDVEAIFAGGHDTAVTSLLAGDCDVAFAAATFVDELLPARGALKPGEVNKIWTSPVIPGPPVVVGNWLPEDLQTKITTALTKYDAVTAAENGFCEGAETEAPETWGEFAGKPSCVWGGTAAFAFVPTNDEAYEPIREICEITKAEVCTAEQR
jgi:phosphonate transport system substrate-binding protein